MTEMEKLLTEKVAYLGELEKETQQALRDAPRGYLRVNKGKKGTQYYFRNDAKDYNGTYVRKKDFELVRAIAQRDYDTKLLEEIRIQKQKTEELLKMIQKEQLCAIYDDFSEERKVLISKRVVSPEEYAKVWEKDEYIGKAFNTEEGEIITDRGERVRSKSEKILADKFHHLKIPYKYECPLHLAGFGTVYPDFTLLNKWTGKEYYWEHFGMMGDEEYSTDAVRKIETYQKAGIFLGKKLLVTFETKQKPINTIRVEELVREYFSC
jgi:hypothetical protein